MQKEYHPHNYDYLQTEQPNTSKLNISNHIVIILRTKEECQNVEASVAQKREQTRSKIANRLLLLQWLRVLLGVALGFYFDKD